MAFLDKLFKFKRKPFKEGEEVAKEVKKVEKVEKAEAKKGDEPRGSGKLAHVIVRPHISEKAAALQTMNKYVFEIDPYVNKHEVQRAIKDLYGVQPTAVRIINIRGKQLRFGRTQGATKAWKKAIITLPAGKTLDVYKK